MAFDFLLIFVCVGYLAVFVFLLSLRRGTWSILQGPVVVGRWCQMKAPGLLPEEAAASSMGVAMAARTRLAKEEEVVVKAEEEEVAAAEEEEIVTEVVLEFPGRLRVVGVVCCKWQVKVGRGRAQQM